MNSLVAAYRQRVPNDPASDDQLTLLFGQQNDQDGRFNGYPDFVQDYNSLKSFQAAKTPDLSPRETGYGEEFSRGVSRGVSSLESTAYGLGALGAGAVGADSLKQALVNRYNDAEQASAQESPASVNRVEDIKGPDTAARYALGKAGELVPNALEAVGFGVAGGLAGTAVEPGGGTVVGGTGGLLEGFLARQAAKSALKALIEDGAEMIADKGVREVVKGQLESIAKREALDEAIAPATKQLLEDAFRAKAKQYGMKAAETLNFGAMGAGGEYPKLAQTPGAENPETGALIAGIGGAAGAILPSNVIGKFLPGVGEDVAETYMKRLALNAAEHIPAGTVGMGAMELGNIAAERYSDPAKRDQPLTDEEVSRILNAATVGAIAGGVSAPLTAIKGPAQTFDPAVEQHFENVPEERRQQIAQLKGRVEAAGASPDQADLTAVRTLSPEERQFYAVAQSIKPSAEEDKTPTTSAAQPDKATSEAGGAPTPPAPQPPTPTPPTTDPAIEERLAKLRAASVVSNADESDPTVAAARAKLEAARAQTDTEATTRQKMAGNYSKGEVNIDGLRISIENPKGSQRTGIGPDGTPWKVEMPGDYGYILGTKGKDKDHVDVTIGPEPKADTVYVVDQVNPKTGDFDEHKTFLNYGSQAQAEAAYDASFSDGSGPQRRGAVTAMSKEQFKEWLKGDTTKPLKYGKPEPAPAKPETMEDWVAAAEKTIRTQNKASLALLQRTHKWGMAKASRVMAELEKRGVVGPPVETEPGNKFSTKRAILPPKEGAQNANREQSPVGTVRSETPEPTAQVAEGKPGELQQPAGARQPTEAKEQVAPPVSETVLTKPKEAPAAAPAEPVQSELDLKIAKAKDEFSDLLKELNALPEPDMGRTNLTLNPKDFLGLDPKAVAILSKLALKALEIGGYKIEQFARAFVGLAGQKFASYAASIYETLREHFTPDPKAGKAGEPEALKKMTPRENMADALVGLSKEFFGSGEEKNKPATYAPEHQVTVDDIDFAGRGVRDVSARGRESELAEKLYEEERARYLKSKAGKKAAETLKGLKALENARTEEMEPAENGRPIVVAFRDPRTGERARGEVTGEGVFRKRDIYAVKVVDKDGKPTGETRKVFQSETVPLKQRGRTEARQMESAPEPTFMINTPRTHEESKALPWSWKELGDIRGPHGENWGQEKKDVFVQTLPETTRRQVYEQQKLVKQPAYYVPKGGQKFADLAEQLLSDSAPEGSAANTRTHRLVDIRDDETGKIHRVSVWENNRKAGAAPESYVWVTRNDKNGDIFPGVGRKSSTDRAVKLADVLDARASDGSNRYRIVGSLRTEGQTEYYHSEFPNRKAYNESFQREAALRSKAAEGSAQAEAGKMARFGTEAGAQAAEQLEESKARGETPESEALPHPTEEATGGGQEDEAQGQLTEANYPKPQHEPRPLNLDAHDMQVMRDMPAFRNLDEITDLLGTPAITPEMYETIAKVAKADPYFWSRVEETDLAHALKEYGYDIDAREGGPTEQLPVREAQAGVRPPGVGGEQRPGGPETNLEGGENRAGAAEQAGSGQRQAANSPGNKVPPGTRAEIIRSQERSAMQRAEAAAQSAPRGTGVDPVEEQLRQRREFLEQQDALHEETTQPMEYAGGEMPKGTMFRKPEGEQQHDPQAERLVRSIHEAAARAGMDVKVVQSELGSGAYNPKNRTFLQVLGNTIGSQDVRTAFHEVGHDVFASEAPEVRQRIVNSISRVPDEALGIDTSADSRIRASDPANLGQEGLQSERLAEAVSNKLYEDGFDPEQAKGIAQRFVRQLKDLYLRSAMAVQRMLGLPESPDLARAYFENKVKALLAGDTGPRSFMDFLGVRKLTTGERAAQSYHSERTTAERFSPEGTLEYDHVPDLSAAASRFNLDSEMQGWKYRRPDDDKADPATRSAIIERRAAVLNHKADTIKAAAEDMMKNEEVAKAVRKSKQSPEAFVRKVLNVDDPEEAKKALANEREIDGSPVPFNAEKRVKDFKGDSNRDQVLHAQYRNVQGMLSRIDRERQKSLASIEDLKEDQDKYTTRLNAAQADLKEVRDIKADKSKVVPNVDTLEKRYKRKAAQARLDLASTNRQTVKENAKVAALEAIAPAIQKEHNRLTEALQVRPDFIFKDKAPYVVPEKPDVSTKDLAKGVKKLGLDSTGEKVTNFPALQEDMRKMQAFVEHRENLAAGGDENAKDIGYQAVKQTLHEMLARTVGGYDTDVKPANRWSFMLRLMPDGRRMAEAFGTLSARNIMRRLNDYVTGLDSQHSWNERNGRITGQLERKLLDLVPKMDRDRLRENVLTPVRDELKRHSDLAEKYAGEPEALKRAQYARVRDMLLSSKAVGPELTPVIRDFMPRLMDLIDHQWNMAQHRLGEAQKSGLGVEDTRLGGVANPATGERAEATRRHLAIGPYSFPRKFARHFGTMVKALRSSGWDSMGGMLKGDDENPSKFGEAYAEDPESARQMVAGMFDHGEDADAVQRDFLRALAETPETFDAPGSGAEEGRQPADPSKVKIALDEAGPKDPVGFAERLFELHGGEGDKAQYVESVMRRLYDRYKESNDLFRQFDSSDTPEGRWAIRGMSPDALIDARRIEHLPATWFDYHNYDRRESFSVSQRIAAQNAFGRGQAGLGADFDTLGKEVQAAKDRLDKVTRAVKTQNPDLGVRDTDRLVRSRLGPDYDRVSKMAGNSQWVASTVRELSDYFRKEGSPDLTLSWVSRFSHTLGQLLVNNPTSALNQMEQLFGLHLRYGSGGSTIRGTAQTLAKFGSEMTRSLAQAVGYQMQDGSWTHRMWTDLNLSDPDAVMKLNDAFVRQFGESGVTQSLRGVGDVMGLGANRVGPTAEHTVFRPLQPFTTVAMASEKALTEALWRMVGAHVANGTKFYLDNRSRLADENFKLDSKALGLTGREKYSFDRLTGDMKSWGMDYDSMVRDAIQRGDGKPFGGQDALRLYSMGLAEVLGESSLANMPSASYTNSIYRVISPLLGWSFRRGMSMLEAGKTPEGRRDIASVLSGLGGLGIMAGGGLGVSAIVNGYAEDVLGKKRNLRPMDSAMGAWENLNRVGTFGLLGEGVNGLINVGTGADNRILDVDKRVVALSAISGLTSAISAMVNQGGPDYAHVVRPMIGSLGGSSALQYMQLANRALGLDNPESRMVARTNAQNWLRAAGRDLEMDVRESGGGGGYSNTTPMSPSLTKMELAAYGNSPGDFMEAYRDAVAKAKDQGNPDPVDYVKRAYAARNPLRQIFRTPPSEAEYQRLLASMPSDGSTDVREAVNLFNAYADRIGARPFEGKPEKPEPKLNLTSPRMAFGANQFRDRAMSALYR